ncbi:MAG: tRNA (guanosine(46)-N7)-methyltransferase TrmB [Phycisphaerae bacterium]
MQTRRELLPEHFLLDTEALPRPIGFAELFGNANPVELEIGSGKGTFITDQARRRPEVNFLGLEWARWFARYAADRLRRHGCANARMARAEANWFCRELIGDGTLAAVHIYFPDPWPKARHHKRRIVQPPFMLEINRMLAPGGRLQVVTDHAEYFQHIEPTVHNSVLEVTDYQTPGSAAEGETVGTNFERKYAREGRPFHTIAARKPAS